MYNYTNEYSYHLFSSYTPIENIVTFAHSSQISQLSLLLAGHTLSPMQYCVQEDTGKQKIL